MTTQERPMLPPTKTCGDCLHINHCGMYFGQPRKSTECKWSPSLFVERPAIEPLTPGAKPCH